MLKFLLYLWDYSIIIPGAFMCALPVMEHSKIKPKRLVPLVCIGLSFLSCLLSYMRCFLNTGANVPLVGAVIVLLGIYLNVFDVKKTKLLYLFISAAVALSFGGLSTYYIEAIMDSHHDTLIAYGVKWGISLLFMAVEIINIDKIKWLFDNEDINTIWNFVWFVPVTILIMNIILIPADYANVRIGRAFILYVTVEIVAAIFFLVFTMMIYLMAKAITRESEARQNAQLLGFQASQYSSMKNYLDASSRMRHDFRYMAKTAQALAAEGEIEKLRDLLDEYGTELDILEAPHRYCENTALNAITAYYVGESKNKGINFTAQLNVPQNIHISDSDLCSIVGNILDNAVEAANETTGEDRSVLFVADTRKNGDLYIAVSNSYSGKIKKTGKIFLTTKSKGHGIGLESVKAVVNKNNGYCNFRYDDNKFYSEIMIKK